jgi:alpha-beta hydrolase superfamily lysophospholipase
VVIGVGGWGVPAEALPRTPEEVKAYVKDIKQAPGLSVPDWFYKFLDLMLENDNWQNAVYDEFVARKSTLAQRRIH